VIVGVGQLSHRVDRGEPALEPVDLLAEALRRAEADAGTTGVLAAADSVRVVRMLSWRYRDPGALVARRLGATPRQTLYTTSGGHTPQSLVNATCLDIAAGRADVVLVGGAEAWRTRAAYHAAGEKPPWTREDDDERPTDTFGVDVAMGLDHERERGVWLPVQLYPMFESAVRAAAGRPIDEHLGVIGRLWSRFSEVAATNPHAWIQQAFSPSEIVTPAPENRMVGLPYTKRMNSNNAVEQAAGIVVCSVGAAERLGVPRDRWVFPVSGTDAHDAAFVSHRESFHRSPAIRLAGRRALDLAGATVDDLAHVDLYSCFPSAVEVAADELGLSLDGDRPLTVTGGLSFAGGPWNDYVTHAIAAMVERLRAEQGGALGLVTANGGFLTRHAVGVYGTRPPAGGFRHDDVQPEVDAATSDVVLAEDHAGDVTIEAYTVMHDRSSRPEQAFAAVRTADGGRAWGRTSDADTMALLAAEEAVGKPAHLGAGGSLRLGG
jgi:acetyl-CoA C-acetyltransferase